MRRRQSWICSSKLFWNTKVIEKVANFSFFVFYSFVGTTARPKAKEAEGSLKFLIFPSLQHRHQCQQCLKYSSIGMVLSIMASVDAKRIKSLQYRNDHSIAINKLCSFSSRKMKTWIHHSEIVRSLELVANVYM